MTFSNVSLPPPSCSSHASLLLSPFVSEASQALINDVKFRMVVRRAHRHKIHFTSQKFCLVNWHTGKERNLVRGVM